MCLLAKRKKMKVAKKDIKCYKRIRFFFDIYGEIKFVTPYQWTAVPIDVLLGKQEFSALGNLEVEEEEKGKYAILGGVIHTYAYEMDSCKSQCIDELVVPCIIPKGTKYIEGNDGWWGFKSFAAQTIKVDAVFKDEKGIKEEAVRVKNRFKKYFLHDYCKALNCLTN